MMIAERFHGPPASGNGGYVCGRLAAHVDGPARVRLHVPPPLGTELAVRDDGASVRLLDGDTVVAVAEPTDLDVDVPSPVTYAEAEEASRSYRGFESHWFPTCFVCGPEREPGDGLRIFPGAVAGRNIVACPWRPHESLGDGSGRVRPEFLWAALDCPGGFAFAPPTSGAILLGELAARIDGPVRVGERCVLIAWEIEHDRRKHRTGTALFSKDGACRALSVGTWIEIAAAPGSSPTVD
jgi:hypothetical protein